MSSLTFEKHLQSVRSLLRKRGCLKKPVDNQLGTVVENRPEQLSKHETKHETGVQFLVTYHPRFHGLGKILTKYFVCLVFRRTNQTGLYTSLVYVVPIEFQ